MFLSRVTAVELMKEHRPSKGHGRLIVHDAQPFGFYDPEYSASLTDRRLTFLTSIERPFASRVFFIYFWLSSLCRGGGSNKYAGSRTAARERVPIYSKANDSKSMGGTPKPFMFSESTRTNPGSVQSSKRSPIPIAVSYNRIKSEQIQRTRRCVSPVKCQKFAPAPLYTRNSVQHTSISISCALGRALPTYLLLLNVQRVQGQVLGIQTKLLRARFDDVLGRG